MKLSEIVVRKDLAVTGIAGQPGVGYKVPELIEAIKKFLNLDSRTEAVLVGTGSLGHALLGYEGFEEYGLRIVAAFDADKNKVGTMAHGCMVYDVKDLTAKMQELNAHIGIICVPAAHAQAVADLMVAANVKGIWNFANVSLVVPEDVVVQREVIAGGLALLYVKLDQKRQQQS